MTAVQELPAPRSVGGTSDGDASGLAVDLDDLHKSYGPTKAVAGIDLVVATGEIVAILGPNGAGKSTTIDMLLGLTKPDHGHARIFGRSPEQAIATGTVGAMLQSGGLIEYLSVVELLTMMASLYPAPMPVVEVLERTGLTDVATKPASRLSGGQIQRVRFAVSLVSHPDLMVLDEPTVALDVEARHAFWDTMRDFARQGRTVVFATHYLEEADSFADRIVLMARGLIVADGSPTEIKGKVGIRTIHATLVDADVRALNDLTGVTEVERHGDTVSLRCHDSDDALRALLWRYPEAHDIEVVGAGLDEAFRVLTGDPDAASRTPDMA
ncbi:MAG: ABC transporter ATP-binding protein [Candidatus Nanopelagicales bacterium]